MSDHEEEHRPVRRVLWARLLLILPFVSMLWVSSYDSVEPMVAGIPFFYWYQLLWILIFCRADRGSSTWWSAEPCPSTPPRWSFSSYCSALITIIGFFAGDGGGRGDLSQLHEWGLGGRGFGTIVTWFLIGGDLYTAYTFIAVPALMFGAGAIGFFAVPYPVMIYPIVYLMFPRLWSVCHKLGYVTSADFVRGRYGNRWLALAIAVTGIVATMPYIALQLVGIQVVIGAMGVETSGCSAICR